MGLSKYNFYELLEPYEFQDLACKIIQRREEIEFETFGEGKDDGIDLRYDDKSQRIICQVKRYKDYGNLFNTLKNIELPKVVKLKPSRYIIITSVKLDKLQKDKIYNLFSRYINNIGDIISGYDLNNLLNESKYKDIELEFPKLWFNSSNTFFKRLDNIVNNDIYEESRAEYLNILERMK